MAELRAPPRRQIPLSVKLAVALRALGMKESEIDWSHEPALQLRAINEAGTDYDPPQHDPAYIFIRKRAEHDHITFKDNGTGRGDIQAIAHVKRASRKQDEHVARMQAKLGMNAAPQTRRKSSFPKGRKLRSRGFDRRRT